MRSQVLHRAAQAGTLARTVSNIGQYIKLNMSDEFDHSFLEQVCSPWVRDMQS